MIISTNRKGKVKLMNFMVHNFIDRNIYYYRWCDILQDVPKYVDGEKLIRRLFIYIFLISYVPYDILNSN